MPERGRREYAERVRQRYALADKRERGRILDEDCRVTECHRTAAIRRLRAAGRPSCRSPGRPRAAAAAGAALAGQRLSVGQTAPCDRADAADRPAHSPRAGGDRPRARRPAHRESGHARPAAAPPAPPPPGPTPPGGHRPARGARPSAAAHLERVDRRDGGRDARRCGLALWGIHRGPLLRHAGRRRRGHDVDGTAGDLGPAPAARHRWHPCHLPAGALRPARVA